MRSASARAGLAAAFAILATVAFIVLVASLG